MWIPLTLAVLGALQANMLEQPVFSPGEVWSFGASEQSLLCERADYLSLPGSLQSLQLSVLQMAYAGGLWQPCEEARPLVHVCHYADNGGLPGELLREALVPAELTPQGIFYRNDLELQLLELDLPWRNLSSGWFSIEGMGDGSCQLMWGEGSGGDGYSCVRREGIWRTIPSDLALRASWVDLPSPSLQIQSLADGRMELAWSPSSPDFDYLVEYSPDGSGWSLLQTVNQSPLILDPEQVAPGVHLFRVRCLLP
jgi:hypothetical protein